MVSIKNSGLGTVLLKAGQGLSADLVATLPKETIQGCIAYSAKNWCKVGVAGLAAYTLDEAISCTEELIPYKPVRGLIPLLGSTLGVIATMHFAGDYLGAPETEKFMQTASHVINNYQNSLMNLIAWEPTSIHAGYLTGALMTLKSGARLTKNIGKSIEEWAIKKRAKDKQKEEKE